MGLKQPFYWKYFWLHDGLFFRPAIRVDTNNLNFFLCDASFIMIDKYKINASRQKCFNNNAYEKSNILIRNSSPLNKYRFSYNRKKLSLLYSINMFETILDIL